MQHLRYLWNTLICVLILLGQFTYLWLGNLFDISSINICSTFLSYSVTKSNMEDFVSIVLVFENPSLKTCKQYNNTGEAQSIETVQSLIEILIQLPTESSGWVGGGFSFGKFSNIELSCMIPYLKDLYNLTAFVNIIFKYFLLQ